MPKGDHLARGGKSAQFQQPMNELPGTDVWSRPPIASTDPNLQSVAEEIFTEYAPVELPAPEAPKVGYRGKAFGDCILVQRVEKEHTSQLIIPDSMRAKSDIGYIYSAGAKCEKVTQGMLVLFDRFASHGAEIDLIDEDGIQRKLLLLREFDVQCELEKIRL